MTDKQIIYDDVEVKDCIAYAKSQTVYLGNTLYSQAENICMVKNQPCKYFDCQFKQMARELKAKEQALQEVKDVLNFYANSKIGEEQEDGTYKMVEKTVCALGGTCVVHYDPRPAKEALKRISEVEDDR